MYFILKSSSTTNLLPPYSKYTNESITPFPFTGRFKVRIVGYEFWTSAVGAATLVSLYSRALVNPCMPYFFQFLPYSLQPAQMKSGWWEVELHNGIDISVVATEPEATFPPYQLLIHLELVRLDEKEMKH